MTVSEKKAMEDMQRKIEELTVELRELKYHNRNDFENLDTDSFLTEVYN
ncbi:hypothetical protein ACFPU1_10580 [Thalassorhabdus alkalitolerans]|uniref:Uncharacterized protein n=1 Tax=Thalassorhabdus alkalitolerans TaxID=2282697 RepID=A0ABW0YPE8_9BACI|nr:MULTISPECIES: hypothetical protein [Bacillaceae]